ncbi:MAG: VOC family protein [Hyalangium sp.]|uniref:VOC family protein n=1 Tax=Hyalangium sp. TaxID=2028555 RepID=UPI00389A0C63
MLLTHAKFRGFTPKDICDTSKAVEVLLTLSCESREQVDDLVARAVAGGSSTYDKPEDYGFMYTHSFVDPDGHGYQDDLLSAAAAPGEEEAPASDASARAMCRKRQRAWRLDWAGLLRKTFAVDVFYCPRCGGRRRVLA